MDLNGTWSDSLESGQIHANNGKYDTRSGDLNLEIWVSRLKADNLPNLGSEANLLRTYLAKDHRYRCGGLRRNPTALVYNDDDWDYMGSDDQVQCGAHLRFRQRDVSHRCREHHGG